VKGKKWIQRICRVHHW